MKAHKILTDLEFQLANDLVEVIAETPKNNLAEVVIVAKTIIAKTEAELRPMMKPSGPNPLTLQGALSSLAKKYHMEPKNSSGFLSLSEIIAQARGLAEGCKNIKELRSAVENFDGCGLKKMATNTVFGDGNPESDVMLIGEAPGNNEDLEGIPFCGESGKMLDEMLGFVGLTRAKNFYITNSIFWRPPGNRKPTDDELSICRPFVERHIQLISPKIIILVGATAMSSILGGHESISKFRGKFMDFKPDYLEKPLKLTAIFHPAYLLRQPSKKKVMWLDLLNLEKELSN